MRQAPIDFHPVRVCNWAELVDDQPEFIVRQKHTGHRLLGVKYEAAGHEWLKARYGVGYTPGQWVRFKADKNPRVRWCQPDGIILDSVHKSVTIVEFKYQHTEGAWWQLFMLYRPVVERLFDGMEYQVKCVEVCKWFDVAVCCPDPVVLCRNIDAVERGQFGVHIWKP